MTSPKSFPSQILSPKSWTKPAFFRYIVDQLHSPLQRATHSLKRREFVGQRPEQSVRPTISFPFGLVSAGAKNDDFLFKPATKLGPQMVYELNETSTICLQFDLQLNCRLRGRDAHF